MEPGGGPRRHHDVRRIDGRSVFPSVVSRDGLAQGGNPERHRVADPVLDQSMPRRPEDTGWRGRRRLADLKVQHLLASCFTLRCRLHDVHDNKGRDLPSF